jgi:hypothetical protein
MIRFADYQSFDSDSEENDSHELMIRLPDEDSDVSTSDGSELPGSMIRLAEYQSDDSDYEKRHT